MERMPLIIAVHALQYFPSDRVTALGGLHNPSGDRIAVLFTPTELRQEFLRDFVPSLCSFIHPFKGCTQIFEIPGV